MAPRSISGASSSTSTSSSPIVTSASSEFPDSHKPGPSHNRVKAGRRKPSMLQMVLEALQAGDQRQATSVVAIKVYILQTYPTVDGARFKYLLRRALDTGMRQGLLTRPANSKARGATGSFKLAPKNKKKNLTKRMDALTGPRRGADAKQADPKKPRQPKQRSADVARTEKANPKLGVASKAHLCFGSDQEKASKKANYARNAGSKPEEARKAPPKSDQAIRVSSHANEFSGKSKVKDSERRQEAHRKTKADGERAKPPASKVHNSVASPAKKKMAARPQRETTSLKAEVGPKTKATSQAGGPKAQPTHTARKTEVAATTQRETTSLKAEVGPKTKATPQAGGPKAQPTHTARKTEVPKSPRRPGLLAKASSSKALSKKAKT